MKEEADIEKDPQEEPKTSPVKRHVIRPRWLRITLKTLMWIVIAVLLIPVLLYIPPIQDLAVSIAEKQVAKSTGMEIKIGKFRLSFPLKVHLQDVSVLTAQRDTMASVGDAIADVRLMPLLKLDLKLNRLDLEKGYYRMVSADSSMILGIRAGLLTVDDRSSMDLRNMHLSLNKALLRDGEVSLYMDVWKKKPTPQDTTKSTPFLIEANDLRLENFQFGMSMLPTIDTLNLQARNVTLHRGLVDLGQNLVSWDEAVIDGGSVRYLTPTPEWAKAHPAPPSEPSTGPPMRIMGKKIAVSGLDALYATKGVKPAAGFDPSYISVSDVTLALENFYNESSTVRLPITEIRARERSGLQISQGHGTIGVDSIGLKLADLSIKTLFSDISADADLPFAVMALDQRTPMSVKAGGHIGLPDVEAFMPAVKTFTAKLPARKPLRFYVDADGTLARLNIDDLQAEMAGVLKLQAKGYADNALDYKKLDARITLDGALMDPALAQEFLAMKDMRVPAFHIKGTAEARGLAYGADLSLTSTAGDVAAKGHVALTPEKYEAVVDATRFNVAAVMPSLGIGHVTAYVDVRGAGFNPLKGNAVTDAIIRVDKLEYKGKTLTDIRADATLSGAGDLQLLLNSANKGLNLELDGSGTILPDDYTIDMQARINDLDLQYLGLTDSMCNGKGTIYLSGTASPDRWLYDAELKLVDFDWNLPGRYIHLPGGVTATVKATELATTLDLESYMTSISFRAPEGLKAVVDGFMQTADTLTRQIDRKNIAVDGLRAVMPRFKLDMNASGRGLLGQLLAPGDIKMDTVWGHIERDSMFSGQMKLLSLAAAGYNIDTLSLRLSERGQLLDYKIHMGNRPGTLDEFANVNMNGYLGNNRLSAYLTQRNIKGENGYRLGMTASMMDSTVNVHFTPLKATIAYMPWTLNNDNYIALNFKNMHVDANLMASSAESSIVARTEDTNDGAEQLRLQIANLKIEDFLNMSVTAPPIKGAISSDLTVRYKESRFDADGFMTIKGMQYGRNKMGDFDLDVNGGYSMATKAVNGSATMRVDGRPAIRAYAFMSDDRGSMAADSVGVELIHLPLSLANPFLGKSAVLSGAASGNMKMGGDFSNPQLNGELTFESGAVRIPMFGAELKMDSTAIVVKDNVLQLDDYDIWAANKNPLTLNGTVDATKLSDVQVDLTANAANMQLINSDKRSRADLFGKIFLNIGATARGPLRRLDINGNVNILGTTDATYRLNIAPSELTAQSDQNVVRFVNFNDTTTVAAVDTVQPSALNMRINANLQISPGTQIEVLLSTNGTDKLQITPTANLNYRQSFLGDMNMTGTLTLGNGFVRYAIPVMGEKMFDFEPNSTLTWTGNVTNPTLNVTAVDKMKANVTDNGNSRLVNFLITLYATNPVDRLKVAFDLSTNDDLTVQNELQSMSADQRQTQAMNLLLYGQYTGMGGTKGNANIGGNVLYSFLESQLNSWAAKNIRGVDLSFGVDQYERANNGAKTTETSYSYQVSKSLFNNRFKIQVGGNYSTDQSAEENLAQNLISDVSFEYIIKQTATQNMSVQLFRRQNYESILEGEITEMGVAFVFKRKLGNLLRLFRRRKHRAPVQEIDTTQTRQVSDTIIYNEVK